MVLDEPSENDLLFESHDVKFYVDKNLAVYYPEINVGFRRSWFGRGFIVEPARTGGC